MFEGEVFFTTRSSVTDILNHILLIYFHQIVPPNAPSSPGATTQTCPFSVHRVEAFTRVICCHLHPGSADQSEVVLAQAKEAHRHALRCLSVCKMFSSLFFPVSFLSP